MVRSPFVIQDCLSYAEFSVFLYETENCPFKICEELCWDFDGNFIKAVDFSRMTILTMSILLSHENGRSFHLLISSSTSFFNVLTFLSYKSLLLGQSCSKLFYIIGGYCERYSLIFFPLTICHLQIVGLEFCELILYLATLLRVFISCRSFLEKFCFIMEYNIHLW